MSTTTVLDHKRLRPVAGLAPYTGTFSREQLIHLLKRTMFGAKKADVDYFEAKTLAAIVDELLTDPAPLTRADFPLRHYGNINITPTGTTTPISIDDPHVEMGKTWVYAPINGDFVPKANTALTVRNTDYFNSVNGQRRVSLKSWWVGRMVHQTRSITEKMVLFWHNHFATESLDTNAHLAFWCQNICRKHVLGKLKPMVREMTLDPNMLYYLNGRLNRKSAPDENYARELQELFTLGKGPGSQYTEDDVKAAAKVLTGWQVNINTPSFNLPLRTVPNATVVEPVKGFDPATSTWAYTTAFNPTNHDATNKQFSSFYGNRVITASVGLNTQPEAERELDDMLNMIFAQSEVAKFICRKIYRHFVYYEIDATIEAEVITPMADLYRANDYNIKPVLRALLMSEHFHEVAQKACFIKSPLEYVVGMAREFDVQFGAETDYLTRYVGWSVLAGGRGATGAAQQGQDIADPPNVAGWPAYYQEPVFHEFWINTDTFPKRMKYMEALLPVNTASLGLSLGNINGVAKYLLVDVLRYTSSLGTDVRDPNIFIDVALQNLYRVPPTEPMRAFMKNILLNGQTSDHYWTDAWDAYTANPTGTAAIAGVKAKLISFYLFLMRNPEYQLI